MILYTTFLLGFNVLRKQHKTIDYETKSLEGSWQFNGENCKNKPLSYVIFHALNLSGNYISSFPCFSQGISINRYSYFL